MDEDEFTNLIQVPCHFCNAQGRLPVTKEMLLDAGISNMDTWYETCPYCFGDCYLIEQDRSEKVE